jgi:2-amino-4-hydroxy-6-hydroxymethyldihydropteridine diphosphokinase
MTGIYLLLGSNLGDRDRFLELARVQLEQSLGKVCQASSIYKTQAWQMDGAPDFLNKVILIERSLKPLKVLEVILKIESGLGRIREGYRNRSIDIDILYINSLILNHPDLTIPHPRISQRRFVLEPLVEIAPDFVHPISGLTNQQMLNQCRDQLKVSRL